MTPAQYLLVIAALLAANIPFICKKSVFILPRYECQKPLWARLIELVALYLIIGCLANLFEGQAYGSAYTQGWEFYAITFALFAVLAYPGFVFRYFWLEHK